MLAYGVWDGSVVHQGTVISDLSSIHSVIVQAQKGKGTI